MRLGHWGEALGTSTGGGYGMGEHWDWGTGRRGREQGSLPPMMRTISSVSLKSGSNPRLPPGLLSNRNPKSGMKWITKKWLRMELQYTCTHQPTLHVHWHTLHVHPPTLHVHWQHYTYTHLHYMYTNLHYTYTDIHYTYTGIHYT